MGIIRPSQSMSERSFNERLPNVVALPRYVLNSASRLGLNPLRCGPNQQDAHQRDVNQRRARMEAIADGIMVMESLRQLKRSVCR